MLWSLTVSRFRLSHIQQGPCWTIHKNRACGFNRVADSLCVWCSNCVMWQANRITQSVPGWTKFKLSLGRSFPPAREKRVTVSKARGVRKPRFSSQSKSDGKGTKRIDRPYFGRCCGLISSNSVKLMASASQAIQRSKPKGGLQKKLLVNDLG